jgi:hypothetical protein
MYSSAFGHAPTCAYTNCRLNESFIPKQNMEQRINIKFCVGIGNSPNETLALLTLVYGDHARKTSSVL